MKSLCVMGWGLAPTENSSAVAAAAAVVVVAAAPLATWLVATWLVASGHPVTYF